MPRAEKVQGVTLSVGIPASPWEAASDVWRASAFCGDTQDL